MFYGNRGPALSIAGECHTWINALRARTAGIQECADAFVAANVAVAETVVACTALARAVELFQYVKYSWPDDGQETP